MIWVFPDHTEIRLESPLPFALDLNLQLIYLRNLKLMNTLQGRKANPQTEAVRAQKNHVKPHHLHGKKWESQRRGLVFGYFHCLSFPRGLTSSSSSSPSLSIIWRSFFFSSSVSSRAADSSSLWRPCSRALACFRRALISSSSSSRGLFVPLLGWSHRNKRWMNTSV